ncbi:MAG TPA: PAS domain-containing sensor histidine kinase, partial [Actinomycetota bacterium]|nr:PAS domain-containing sensor histidine kinase [Actinomycetota bacterium]
MTVLSSLAGRHTTLSARAVDHLHRLLGEWQLLSDLAFADLLLLAPVVDRSAFVVLGQVRPYPAQTLYPEDMVGSIVDSRERPKAAQAVGEKRIVSEGDPEWRDGTPIREVAIPVMFEDEPIAVITAEQNLASARTPSHLELSYLRAAAAIEQMVAEGTFPFVLEEEGERELSPRVGDGFLELDGDLRVTYASPNAVSAYRRLGMTTNVTDERLSDLPLDHARIVDGLDNDTPVEDEIEIAGAWVLRRFIPIVIGGERKGAIGFVRDITESRLRDRMLLIKDATIREIHHRVKNNLQTVASLLRLQARRLGTNEARAELEESVRRISSIALVHETLSRESTENVEFDRVAQSVLEMVESSLVHPDRPVRFSLEGSAGELPSEVATPLSLILTELIQNAVEHAFAERGGTVTVELKREDPRLLVFVRDDGAGLPSGFSLESGSNLGLQIARTLLLELTGEISVTSNGGTTVELSIPL